MLQGAPDRLASEFPKAVAEKFNYLAFAEDDKKDDQGNVILIKMRRREFQAHT